GPEHVGDWHGYGVIPLRVPYPRFHPSAVGYRNPASGGDSLREPALLHAACVSRHHVVSGALHCIDVRTVVLYAAGSAAAGRLGDVVGGALSHRTVRIAASIPHSSAQRHVARVAAKDAHVARLRPIPDVPRTFWSGSVSRADRARRVVQPYG